MKLCTISKRKKERTAPILDGLLKQTLLPVVRMKDHICQKSPETNHFCASRAEFSDRKAPPREVTGRFCLPTTGYSNRSRLQWISLNLRRA